MQNFRLATRPGSRRYSFNKSQKIPEKHLYSHDSQSKQTHQEAKVEKIQKEEEKEDSSDWRSILAKMNQSVNEVKALPKEPDPPQKSSPSKDFTDIKLEYRRIKIREQCQKLNTKVNIPSRSSWRDRINGGESANSASSSSATSSSPDSDARRNLTWGQRRTKVYHINSDIEVHKFKIIDTIHLKRSQIEARLAEYNNSVQNRNQDGNILMLTYTDQEYLNMLNAAKAGNIEESTKKDVVSPEAASSDGADPNQDQNLDGLVLKDNTKKKLSQFNKNITEKGMKVSSPTVPKKKKYNSSVDWREELKNRDRAKQLEDLKRYKVGMPDYKEPEKEKEEMEQAQEKRKAEMKTKGNWKRISLKPTTRPEEKKKDGDSGSKPDEPFKVSLRPVRERKANKNDVPNNPNEKDSNVPHHSPGAEFDKEKPSFLKKNLENIKKEKAPSLKKSASKQELEEKSISKKKTTEDKQYVIKIINFVAIKVPVEEKEAPPRIKKKIERKPSTREKPPIPKVKPPALPKDTLDFSVANEAELESFETEIANAMENEQFNCDYLKDLLIEIIRDNPNLSKAEVKKAKVQTCPTKPKVQSKQKDGQSFEDKYFKPKRKKMLDYFPETVPLTLRKPEEIRIEPMKFSSVSDNCVTKSLFIGSQYTGQRH